MPPKDASANSKTSRDGTPGLASRAWVGGVGPMIAGRHATPNENLPRLGTIVVLPTLLSGAWIWKQQIDVFRELCPNVVEFADPLVRWPVAPNCPPWMIMFSTNWKGSRSPGCWWEVRLAA